MWHSGSTGITSVSAFQMQTLKAPTFFRLTSQQELFPPPTQLIHSKLQGEGGTFPTSSGTDQLLSFPLFYHLLSLNSTVKYLPVLVNSHTKQATIQLSKQECDFHISGQGLFFNKMEQTVAEMKRMLKQGSRSALAVSPHKHVMLSSTYTAITHWKAISVKCYRAQSWCNHLLLI